MSEHIPEIEEYVKRLNWYLQEHYPANKKITAEEWNALFLALMNQGNAQEDTLAKICNEILPGHVTAINDLIDFASHYDSRIDALENDVEELHLDISDLDAAQIILSGRVDSLETGLSGKLDKSLTPRAIYGTNNSGEQSLLGYTDSATGWSIAQRNADGNTKVGLIPTDNQHATSKKYVDDNLDSLSERIAGAESDIGVLSEDIADLENEVEAILDELPNKQNIIEDLTTIRSGASAGATALQPSDVINNISSTTTNKPLSANMGKELQDQINVLKSRGRYLSIWNCTTGLAETTPTVDPYVYRAGDYFIVGVVDKISQYAEYDPTQTYSIGAKCKYNNAYYICNTDGTTGAWNSSKWTAHTIVNYKPSGTTYSASVPSTIIETADVKVNDTYYYDGTTWTLLDIGQVAGTFGSLGGSPYDNSNLASALNSKQDSISDISTIRSNASAGKSASDTITTYGNIVTHNTSEFATAAQGTKADNAVQDVKDARGTSLVSNGVATIPFSSTTQVGMILANAAYGVGNPANYNGTLVGQTRTYEQYVSGSDRTFISKGTLENVITGKGLSSVSVSSTGSSTNEIRYITVNGIEHKLAGGGGGGGEVIVDNITISKNTDDELQAIGLTNGTDVLTYADINEGIEAEIKPIIVDLL